MALTVVNIAYPVVPIGHDTVGGTEQVVAHIDEALVRAGHNSIVVGSETSQISGRLIPTPAPKGPLDKDGWDKQYAIHRKALRDVLQQVKVDVVHMHGIDFELYLPDPGPPVLATLHLPPSNYPATITRPRRPFTFLNGVSSFSRGQYSPSAPMVVIPNGVPLDRFRPNGAPKENFVLGLGRICPEKGFHLALDAAKRAGLPMILGGSVPPFPEAVRYYEEEIVPRLDSQRRFIGPVPLAQRVDLLSRARCAVIPSLFDETCSLVTLEALACGTPVVAHPAGALLENIEHGRTGLFAQNVDEMSAAFHEVVHLDSHECRVEACERFSVERMAKSYVDLYGMLATMGQMALSSLELFQVLTAMGRFDSWRRAGLDSAGAPVGGYGRLEKFVA